MNKSTLAVVPLAYLLGSIPFSHLITVWRTGLVLREVGEGNVGSRNVWHVVGPVWGALAMVLDALKGLAVFLAVAWVHLSALGMVLAGVAVMLGHQFPLFLRGRGGKGLATGMGFVLGLSPVSTIAGLALMGLAYLFFHDFNPSVIVGAIGVIFLPLLFGQVPWGATYAPSLLISACALGLALLAGVKKLIDRPHEMQVWASHPWQGGARPGFHQEEGSDQAPAPDPGPCS